MAEGALREAARKAGLECTVDSAGTASYHIGSPPDPRAIETAREKGIDISGALGRQISPKDFDRFTHVFALDNANIEGIKARAPRHGRAKVALLLDAVSGTEGQAVPDPYYGEIDDFEACWDMIGTAVDAIVAKLQKEGPDATF
jgi:protein-tyrosine phosphatase